VTDRLSRWRVTADATIRTEEILLAADAEDAAAIHERTIEAVAEEFGAEPHEIEILEVDELDGETDTI
jgi:hypothetical protein